MTLLAMWWIAASLLLGLHHIQAAVPAPHEIMLRSTSSGSFVIVLQNEAASLLLRIHDSGHLAQTSLLSSEDGVSVNLGPSDGRFNLLHDLKSNGDSIAATSAEGQVIFNPSLGVLSICLHPGEPCVDGIPVGFIVEGLEILRSVAANGPSGAPWRIVASHKLDTRQFSKEEMETLASGVALNPPHPIDPTVLVRCGTTKGFFEISVHPAWAPIGSRRFVDMVEARYFDGSAFFRVLRGFLVQFGLAAEPGVWRAWDDKGLLKDDPKQREPGRFASPPQVFPRGGVSFAGWGPNSRATNVFIAYREGAVGGSPWEVGSLGVLWGCRVDGRACRCGWCEAVPRYGCNRLGLGLGLGLG